MQIGLRSTSDGGGVKTFLKIIQIGIVPNGTFSLLYMGVFYFSGILPHKNSEIL